MISSPRVRRTLRALCSAVFLVAGCREEFGPEVMPVAPVSGRITIQNRPISGGWIEFNPVQGTVGKLTAARIGPDGGFKSDRAPVGLVSISAVHIPSIPPGLARFFVIQNTPIRRTIPAGGTDRLDIDLAAELLLAQEREAAIRARLSRESAPK